MNQIRPFILRALRRMSGIPMPQDTLTASIQMAFPAQTPSRAECMSTLSDMESEGFIIAITDDLTQSRQWSLTSKGAARAAQLP
jgi:hypothetical protein